MPVYEYKCTHCDETFDVIASLDERDEKAVCPRCGHRDVTLVLRPFTTGGTRRSIKPGNYVRPPGPGARPKHT